MYITFLYFLLLQVMSEPEERWGHFACSTQRKTFMWGGGNIKNTSIEEYDSYLESWTSRKCHGNAPRGCYYGACASNNDRLYSYGGFDVDGDFRGGLGELNTTTLKWSSLSPESAANGPMKKRGAGLVYFGENKIAVVGGWGIPTGPAQPGSRFVKSGSSNGSGWTNEIHVFDLTESKYQTFPLSCCWEFCLASDSFLC